MSFFFAYSTQEEPSASWADRMDDLEASEIDPGEPINECICMQHGQG